MNKAIKSFFCVPLAFSSIFVHANLEESIVYHDGYPFPKIPSVQHENARVIERDLAAQKSLSSSNWFCDPYERTTFKKQASIDLRLGGSTRKKIKKTAQAAFTPPHYYMIEYVDRIKHKTKGTWDGSEKLLQANQQTVTAHEYQELYEELHNYLLSFDLPKNIEGNIDIQLLDFINSYTYMADYLSSTHATVIHNGRVQGRGWFGGESIYRASIDAHVVCAPPEAYSTTAANSTLKSWINARVAEYHEGEANKALSAKITATSTFPGYSVKNIHDGNRDTTVGPKYSWANNSGSSPSKQVVEFKWSEAPFKISKINIYTSSGYELQDYRIEYYTGQSWKQLLKKTGNRNTLVKHTFSPVKTNRIRIFPTKGPNKQTFYVRLNEVEIY